MSYRGNPLRLLYSLAGPSLSRIGREQPAGDPLMQKLAVQALQTSLGAPAATSAAPSESSSPRSPWALSHIPPTLKRSAGLLEVSRDFLLNLAGRLWEVGSLSIRVREPDHDWWRGGWFAPGANTATRETSRGALQQYRNVFNKQADILAGRINSPWKFRVIPFSATGLPQYLRGWATDSMMDGVESREMAHQWLDSTQFVAEAMLGRGEWRVAFPPQVAETSIVRRFAEAATTGSEAGTRFHVRYQQWHAGYPVHGGQLSVHLAQHDPRVSATSTYLPIPDVPKFKAPAISGEQAKHNARLALQHYALQGCLAALKQLLPWALGQEPYRDWRARIRTYAERGLQSPEGSVDGKEELVILPFAGEYLLAYEVWLTSPNRTETWSVFVDAATGDILGRPRNLTCYQRAYASSEEATQSGFVPNPPSIAVSWNNNPCAAFLGIRIYDAAQPDFSRDVNWSTNDTSGAEFEATNVAYHAQQLYNHFVELGADTTKLTDAGRRVTACVATPDLSTLDMGFNPAERLVTFQHQQGAQGLLIPEVNQRVFNPTFDPEVVAHETAHVLMWYLNRDLFENLVEAAPFARSLVEGYANYLGRSVGIGAAQAEAWAVAAYHPVSNEWGDRWALDRSTDRPGQDILAVPGLYPEALATGLIVYDVGMIWARALWDLRQIVGKDVTDELAHAASYYGRGWVTSFETVAEGLVETALLSQKVGLGQALLPLLAARNIVAEQGVQALAASGMALLVGGDRGMARWSLPAGSWGTPNDEQEQVSVNGVLGPRPLGGVVALAVDPTTDVFYAATETGIYRRGPGDPWWRPVGQWPADQYGQAIAVRPGGELYVGTGRGVWTANAGQPAPTWQLFNPTSWTKNSYSGLASDVAVSPTVALHQNVYVAGYTGLWRRPLGDPNSDWKLHVLRDQRHDLVTCVLAQDDGVFIGTGNAGIWQGGFDAAGNFSVNSTPIVEWNGLDEAAVLSLAVVDTAPVTLYAGTSKGIYQGLQGANGWTWSRLQNNLPQGAVATRVINSAGDVYAGTPLHGLFRKNKNLSDWNSVAEVKSLVTAALPWADNAQPLSFTVTAQAARPVYLHPFYLPQQRIVQIGVAPAQPVELWRLGANVQPIAAAANGLINTGAAQIPGFYAAVVRSNAAHTLIVN
ncbi:MAG: hypothetical protein NT169_19690 [Chloroflexi bacterium]|nr:hypothetical protein [Chloroflexota bacterium]